MRQFPYELSGGMRQRVMIAIALAAGPQLLIADEPTTALDVTIQAQILALLLELKRSAELALVLITHDLGAVAGLADRVAVMRHGRIIETAPVARILKEPRDPYTLTLLPSASALSPLPAGAPLAVAAPAALTVSHLTVDFPIARGLLTRPARLRAVNDVSLELAAGESLALVGESGCGKSTLARAVLQLLAPVSGRVVWLGRELGTLPRQELRALRPQLQIIFQDPLASLDARMRVDEIVGEGLRVHAPQLTAAARAGAVRAALERVGLAASLGERYPHELSGGQCQRVGIARAMILTPQLLVCDEPLSALDVPTQQQIVALLGWEKALGPADNLAWWSARVFEGADLLEQN
jgi:ABC-type microcin C transport system duplicated ATPase subunit YejF